jgi:class 3 adenylate cyclase
MSTAEWVGVIAGIVAVAGAIAGYARFMIQAPLALENAKLDAAVERERERVMDLDARLGALQQDYVNLKLGKTGVLLKQEIETDLQEAMDALDVKEGSILVPGPPPDSSRFVFLAIYGPAAAKLTKAKLPIDKGIVGRVFATGRLHSTPNAARDPNFFEGIDKKGEHETRTLLTVPLRSDGRTIGVVQFLNKADGFTRNDETTAEALARSLGAKVATFARDPENFELLGLAWRSEDKEATIAFCDLTSFSSLLTDMNVPSAIDCVNEYLEQQCDVAIRYGATIDKYIGDGVMLRFNVPHRIVAGDHAILAVNAALEMREAFEHLKRGWVSEGLPVNAVYSRIGLSCGPVYEARIGHPQFEQLTVIGEAVNAAANLCEIAPRSRNVVMVDQPLVKRLNGSVVTVEESLSGPDAYEVVERAS